MNKKHFLGIVAGVMLIVLVMLSSGLFETNQAGHFQIKQAALSGKLTARFQPGIYVQNFGDIETYKNVAAVGFGKEDVEGVGNIGSIPVIFK